MLKYNFSKLTLFFLQENHLKVEIIYPMMRTRIITTSNIRFREISTATLNTFISFPPPLEIHTPGVQPHLPRRYMILAQALRHMQNLGLLNPKLLLRMPNQVLKALQIRLVAAPYKSHRIPLRPPRFHAAGQSVCGEMTPYPHCSAQAACRISRASASPPRCPGTQARTQISASTRNFAKSKMTSSKSSVQRLTAPFCGWPLFSSKLKWRCAQSQAAKLTRKEN